MTNIEDLDPRQLRSILGRFFTGVTVVTTIDKEGKAWGVTANSFTSVSLDPPLVLWNQALTSDSYAAFLESDRFTINILSQDQITVSNGFARSGTDKFKGVSISTGLGGVPLINGCCAVLECRKFATHEGGDHTVFIGQVESVSGNNELQPLIFGDGKYMSAQPLVESV